MNRRFGFLEAFFLISVIFLHFVFIRPGEFPLTLAPFMIVYFYFSLFENRAILGSQLSIPLMFGVMGAPLINALQLGWSGADGFQFIRTYALWIMSAGAITISILTPLKRAHDVSLPALISLFVIFLCVLLQAVPATWGDTSYFNLFGKHQYFGEVRLETLAVDDRIRPPGFYLEPSFCAYVVINMCAICLILNRFVAGSIMLAGVSLLLIQSLTGLIAFVVVIGVYSVSMPRRVSQVGLNITGLVGIVCFVLGVMYYYSDYIGSRAEQVDSTGSSTYYRVVGLLPVLLDTLTDSPTGYALGRVKEIVPKYMIPHGTGFGESIDNGIYLLVFYFGWLGLLFAFLIVWYAFNRVRAKDGPVAVTVVSLLMGMFFNGGILLPEFALIAVFLIYAAKLAQLSLRYGAGSKVWQLQ